MSPSSSVASEIAFLAPARAGLRRGVHRRDHHQGLRRAGDRPACLHRHRCDPDGTRDILDLWIGQGGEGAKFWLQVLTEIKNRGTEDACIVVCDGLKGLPEAMWPLAVIQTCVLHVIRHIFRLASRRDRDAMARDLRPVYTALSEQAAKECLAEFKGVG